MVHPRITIAAGVYQIHHRWHAMVAKEQLFFEEAGIHECDIITTNHNDDNLGQELMARNVHFGLDARPQDVFRWVTKQGADIFIIGCFKSQFNMSVLGAKGIKSIADLRGKKIGVSTGKSDTRVSLDEIQAKIMIRSVGLNPDKDVTWVSGVHLHPVIGNPVGALQSGEVDCVFVSDLDAAVFEAQGYPVLLRFKDFYSGGYPDRVIVTTGFVIKQYPETVTAFLKGMVRAFRFFRDMPKNYEYLVDLDQRMRAVNRDPKESPHLELKEQKFTSSPHPPDGQLPLKGLKLILAQEKEAGNIPEYLTVDRVVRLEFLEQANRELDEREDLREELQRVKQWVKKYGY